MTTPELIEFAKNLREKHKIARFYADSAEPDRIKEFSDAGLYVLPGNKDIVAGVNRFRQLIKEDKIRVAPHCKYFIDEIESYHYPERKNDLDEGDEIPEKFNDHALDSSRYVFSTYQPSMVLPRNMAEEDFKRRMKEKRLKVKQTFSMA
jgi:phage terminase large subunit